MIRINIIRHIAFSELGGFDQHRNLLRAVPDLDNIALFDPLRRYVNPLAVYRDVTVVHELPRGKHRRDKLGAINHRVKTTLKQTDQVFTCIAFHTLGLTKDPTKLLFGQVTIMAF